MIYRNEDKNYEVIDNKGYIVGTYSDRDYARYQATSRGFSDNEISYSELRQLRSNGGQ